MDFNRVNVRLYSADGASYYVVPRQKLLSGYTLAECAGGYTEAQFILSGYPEDFNNLVRRRLIEVWASFRETGPYGSRDLVSALLWRGYISAINEIAPLVSTREPVKVEVGATGFFRMIAGQVRVDKAFAFSGLDRASVFADLSSRYVAAAYPTTLWSAQALGDNLSAFDARRALFGEAVERLVAGMGLVCYGSDTATTPAGARVDHLHLKPVEGESSVTHTLPATGSVRSRLLRSHLDAGRQVSALQINGGPVRFPNRLAPAVNGNTGFESPATGSPSAFNQLEDPSFEEYTGSSPDVWTFGGGASRKSAGLSEGYPHHGEWMVELDTTSEYVEVAFAPDDPLVEGESWTFGLNARQAEAVGSGSEGTITVKIGFLNGSDVLIGSYATAVYTPAINLWTGGYQASKAVPASAAKVKVRVEMTTNPAGCLGIVLDSAYLYNDSQVYQSGWETNPEGTGAINRIDWAYDANAHSGAYSVYLDVTASDDDANSVYFYPAGESKRMAASGNEAVRWSVRVASIDGGTTGIPKIRQFLICYDADGGMIYPSGHFTQDTAANASPGADWLEYSQEETLPEEAAFFSVSVNVRGTGKLLLDSAGVFSSNAPAGYWIESDRYQSQIRVSDLFGSGDLFDEAEAIGDVWETIDSDLIIDEESAEDVASALFLARTLPVRQPEIQVNGIVSTGAGKVSAEAMPGERMKALGERSSVLVPDPMVIAEVRHEFKEGKILSRFLGNAVRRDWTVRVLEALARRLRLTAGAGGAFSLAGATFALPSTTGAHTHTAADITDFSEAVDDRAAALLAATDGLSVTYDDGSGTLTIGRTGGGLRTTARYHNDFLAGKGDLYSTTSGTGADVNISNNYGDGGGHPGVCTLTPGTTTTGSAFIGTFGAYNQIRFGYGAWTLDWWVYLENLSDATDTCTVRVGFLDSTSGEPTDGIYFRYTHGTNSGKWQCVTRAAGTETATDSGSAPSATTWYRLTIEVNAGASSVTFRVAGSSVATNTTNIPTGGNLSGLGASIVKSAGTAHRRLLIDAVDAHCNLTTAR